MLYRGWYVEPIIYISHMYVQSSMLLCELRHILTHAHIIVLCTIHGSDVSMLYTCVCTTHSFIHRLGEHLTPLHALITPCAHTYIYTYLSYQCVLKGLPGAIEEAIYVRDKWPLIVDPEGQAARFLRYQRGAFLLGDNRADVEKENLRARLVASLMHGGNLCLVFETLSRVNFEEFFDEKYFPKEVLDRRRIFLETT